MTSPATTCPACGTRGTGRFCSNCGAAFGSTTCPGCGTTRDPAARFCPQCGRSAAGARSARPATPWIVAGIAGLAAAAALAWSIRGPGTPGPAPAAAEATLSAESPPDLSQMTPRERFDRLFNRIMTAAERGDTAEVGRFLPMATMAYQQLESRDADARYHMAMLSLQGGDTKAALAEADTIVAAAPRHLFAALIREAEAARRGDAAGVRRAREAFLSAYDGEIALERQEYAEHRAALERFRAEAPPR